MAKFKSIYSKSGELEIAGNPRSFENGIYETNDEIEIQILLSNPNFEPISDDFITPKKKESLIDAVVKTIKKRGRKAKC